jgi:hypothetical protein
MVLVMLLALVAAACGSGGDATGVAESGTGVEGEASGDGADDGTGDESGNGGDEDPADEPDTGGEDGDEQGEGDPSNGDEGVDAIAPYEPAAYEPSLDVSPIPLLLFNAEGAYYLEEGDSGATELIEGPVGELSSDGDGGILFQRERRSNIIWWLPHGSDAPIDLLVTEDPIHLVLEGVAGQGVDRQVVYQRTAETGVPDTAITELKTYRFSDASVSALTVVGGWESGTTISDVFDGVAAGVWGGEGYNRYFIYDVVANTPLGNPPEGFWEDYLSQEAVFDGVGLVALGLVLDEAQSDYDQMGLYRVDLDGQIQDTIAVFPWDNGNWYPAGLFVDAGFAVISRDAEPFYDDAGEPLGPIVVDLVTGEAITLGYGAYARPAD